tara:strand:+ start:723 stop:1100 length:378 start_codon:yes stop_codon:yes gene_type:complete
MQKAIIRGLPFLLLCGVVLAVPLAIISPLLTSMSVCVGDSYDEFNCATPYVPPWNVNGFTGHDEFPLEPIDEEADEMRQPTEDEWEEMNRERRIANTLIPLSISLITLSAVIGVFIVTKQKIKLF